MLDIGKDFKFRDDLTKTNEGDTVAIELLTGPYKDVIMRYTKVNIKEQNNDSAVLQFDYDLLETASHTMTSLRKDKRFEQHLGILLNHLILESIEGADDARENYSEEPDSKRGLSP
jgi:hypothetical protein